jgi:hypothetical protein
MKLPRPEIKHTRIISLERKAWPKRSGMAHRVVWPASVIGMDTHGLLLLTPTVLGGLLRSRDAWPCSRNFYLT